MKHERTLSIGHDHPTLSGHFPGHPVVPGVVILDEVVETLRELYGQGVVATGLPSVKLSSPLSPGEPLTIIIEQEDEGAASFICMVETRRVATGTIHFGLRVASRE